MNIVTKGEPRVSVAYEGKEEQPRMTVVGELTRFILSGMAILVVIRILAWLASF